MKDASATAIYGSRGANGVVVITTKDGTAGEPELSVTSRYNQSNVLRQYDLMDAATFARVANQRADALNTGRPFSDSQISDFQQNGGTDWQDLLLRTGVGQEYQVDYSGGKNDVTYFVSGNYLDQEGILINSDYKRYSLRTNLKATLSEKLNANLKMNFVRRENNNTSGNGNTSGPLAGALTWAPTTPAYNEDGIPTLTDPVSSIKANPIELANNDNISESNALITNGAFNYEFIEGLTADVSFGLKYTNTQNKSFSASRQNGNPSAGRGSVEDIFLQNTNLLRYKRDFNNIHSFNIAAGIEHQLLQTDRFSANAQNLVIPSLEYQNITLANSVTTAANKTKQTIRSYIGRVNYTLMDRYLLTAAVRSDGSSKFRGDNKFGTFPSLALGWRVSEENFMQGVEFINNLKLRGSYGITGSQAVEVFGTTTTFNTSAQAASTSFARGQLTSGIIIGDPGNSGLKWETTAQSNVGLDMQLFNGRLNLTTDYFKKNTTDLLLSEPLPEYSGGGSIERNLGEVQNKGFEFSLGGVIIDNDAFSWNSNFNASVIDNKVINIGDRDQIFRNPGAGAGLTNVSEMIVVPGRGLANYYGLNYLGTWKSDQASEAAQYGNVPGDSRYEDVNDDGAIGSDDFQIIGNALPEQTFGWNNTFSYNNLSLNIFFQSMTGFDKWNFSYATAITANADAREATHADILNRWQENENEDSNIPHFSQSDVTEIQSSRFVEQGDFLRLKNLSLTYNFPENWVSGVNGSVMIGGNNLWTLTNYNGIDPESFSNRGQGEAAADAGAYPNSKSWNIQLNLRF